MIELDFDDVAAAQGLLSTTERIWASPAVSIMINPRAVIVEDVETIGL